MDDGIVWDDAPAPSTGAVASKPAPKADGIVWDDEKPAPKADGIVWDDEKPSFANVEHGSSPSFGNVQAGVGAPQGFIDRAKGYLNDAGDAAKRVIPGIQKGAAQTLEAVPMAGAALAGLAGQDAQDAYFKHVIEPYESTFVAPVDKGPAKNALEALADSPGQLVGPLSLAALTGGAGAAAPSLARMTLADVAAADQSVMLDAALKGVSGTAKLASAAPLTESTVAQGMRLVGDQVSHALPGATLAAMPGALEQEKAELESGNTVGQTAADVIGNFPKSVANNLLPMASKGALASRALQGAAAQTALVGSEDIAADRPLTATSLIPAAVMGAGFGVMHGERPPVESPQAQAIRLANEVAKTKALETDPVTTAKAAAGDPLAQGTKAAGDILAEAKVTAAVQPLPDAAQLSPGTERIPAPVSAPVADTAATPTVAAPKPVEAPTQAPVPVTAEPFANGKRVLFRGDVDAIKSQLANAGLPEGMVKLEDGQPVGVYYPSSYGEPASRALGLSVDTPAPSAPEPAQSAPSPAGYADSVEPIRNGSKVLFRGDVDAMRQRLTDAGLDPGYAQVENGQNVGVYFPATIADKVAAVLKAPERAPEPQQTARAPEPVPQETAQAPEQVIQPEAPQAPDFKRQWLPTEQRDSKGRPVLTPALDYSRDSLIHWIGKNGGIDFGELNAQTQADPALLKDPDVMRPFGRVGWPALRRNGGMNLDTLRERMEQDGWLPEGSMNTEAAELAHEAINGREVNHPYEGADERTMREYQDRQDTPSGLDLHDIHPAEAEQSQAVVDHLADRYDEAHAESGRDFDPTEANDALSITDLTHRAIAAGADPIDVSFAHGKTPAETARNLWRLVNTHEAPYAEARGHEEADSRGNRGADQANGIADESGQAGRAVETEPAFHSQRTPDDPNGDAPKSDGIELSDFADLPPEQQAAMKRMLDEHYAQQNAREHARLEALSPEDFALEAWRTLGKNDTAYQTPKVAPKTVGDAVALANINAKPSRISTDNDLNGVEHKEHVFTLPNGKEFAVKEYPDSYQVNVANFDTGGGGNRLYNALAGLAKEKGKRFDADVDGFSDWSILRRTENMASNGLKYGADVMQPHARQLMPGGRMGWAKELPWKVGNDAANQKALMLTSLENVRKLLPEIDNLRYNHDSDRIEYSDGRPVPADEFKRLAGLAGERLAAKGVAAHARTTLGDGEGHRQGARPHEGASERGVGGLGSETPYGSASIARAVLTRSLVSARGGKERAAILAKLREQLPEPTVEQRGAGKSLYSKTNEAPADAGVSHSGESNKVAQDRLAKTFTVGGVSKLKRNGVRFMTKAEVAAEGIGGHHSVSDLDGVKGITTADRKTMVVITDEAAPHEVAGTAAHEVFHGHAEEFVGEPAMRGLLNAVGRLSQGKDADLTAARAKVPKETQGKHVNEETAAYLIEDAPNNPLAVKITDAVKLKLNRLGVPLDWINGNAAAVRKIGALTLRDLATNDRGGSTHLRGGDGQPMYQRVFHGTPHRDIEKEGFKLNKIGTGEGAQAYGHGIYFAGNRDVAESYRKNVIDTSYLDAMNERLTELARIMHADENGSYRNYRTQAGRDAAAEYDTLMDERSARAKAAMEAQGQLYHAEIPDAHELLDWDKPLSEQPEGVRKALQTAIDRLVPQQKQRQLERLPNLHSEYSEIARGKAPGSHLYGALSHALGGSQAASEYLNSLGIPGLRYLDGGSRGNGEGSHNFVIWDESRLNNDVTPYYSKRDTATQDMFGAKDAERERTPARPVPTSGDLFGAPTAKDHIDAAARERDAQRNGLRGGRADTGDGGLFDGARPEQMDVERNAAQVQSALHSAGFRDLDEYRAFKERGTAIAKDIAAAVAKDDAARHRQVGAGRKVQTRRDWAKIAAKHGVSDAGIFDGIASSAIFGGSPHALIAKALESVESSLPESARDALAPRGDGFSLAPKTIDLGNVKEDSTTYGDTRALHDRTGRDGADAVAEPSSGRRREAVPGQLDLFAATPAVRRAVEENPAEFHAKTKLIQTGEFRSGVKQIENWPDVAHIIAPLRKSPQEQMVAVVADENRKPLAVIRHSIGERAAASIEASTLFGSIARVPGAKHVWFAHTHPSGETRQSDGDRIVTERLHMLMDGSGIQTHGMIVVAPGSKKATHYESNIDTASDIPAHRRTESVPMLERTFGKVQPIAGRTKITDGSSVRRYVEANRRTGIALLNNQYEVAGFLPMSDADMAKLRTGDAETGSARVAKALETSNASAAVVVARDMDASMNLGSLLSDAAIRHIETAIIGNTGISLLSSSGRMDTGRSFFSRRNNEAEAEKAPHPFVAKTRALVDDLLFKTAPMALGSHEARSVAKDYANDLRQARWEGVHADDDLTKNFNNKQLVRMWQAADNESVAQQQGIFESSDGLGSLTPNERAAVEHYQSEADQAFAAAKSLGMIEGEGLPSYVPRMVVDMGANGVHAFGRGEPGDRAGVIQNFRTLPMATAKLKEAIAGRVLINAIKDIGDRTGNETVREGSAPSRRPESGSTGVRTTTGNLKQRKYLTTAETEAAANAKQTQEKPEHTWFTIDHPAFSTWKPRLQNDPETGKTSIVKDESGNPVFDRVPIYVRGDFKGPLDAVLSHKNGAAYEAAMALKAKTMSLVMYSPIIHNAVEWGRALPAMPGKVATFRIYFDGNKAKNDPKIMREAIQGGMVPIGGRGAIQDLTSIQNGVNLTPGRSWTAKLLAAVPGLFDPRAGEAVKRAVDKAGDVWHNTLLWDRIGDLQAGLYIGMRDNYMKQGMDRASAVKMAGQFANRFAGALPAEAMSSAARKSANLLMFSRSFTLGNLGLMKDAVLGLPKDVQSQILRDSGEAMRASANNSARRTALAAIAVDIGFMYVSNSILQSGIAMLSGNSSLNQEEQNYARRWNEMLQRVKENPMALVYPLDVINSLTPQGDNEPGKQDRILIGHSAEGTAIYMRNPTGKIGEEFIGWMDSPLNKMKAKLSTFAKPAWETLANDKGFGRKVYDPYDKESGAAMRNLGRIAMNFIGAQVPLQGIQAAKDYLAGVGNPTLQAAQVLGPFGGLTFSKGAPGGEQIGQLYAAKDAQQYRVNEAMPNIHKQVQAGDISGAVQAMTELGIPEGLQRYYIRTTLVPSSRMSKKALADFMRYGSPDEQAAMARFRSQQSDNQPSYESGAMP